MDDIWVFVLVGLVAQMIDGALGMAYGLSSTSFLLGLGVPPAVASATVHMAEVFTTGASGLSHLSFGNVDKTLIKGLLIPGVVGGVAGALILSRIPAETIKPFVSLYLLVMGILVLEKAFRKTELIPAKTKLAPLGLIGGFCDAIGGGGWGAVVTSTLMARGNSPRHTIGSTNLTEFFVTAAQSLTFIFAIGISNWWMVLGLLLGGVIAAPISAYVCHRVSPRPLLIMVGIMITILSLRGLAKAFLVTSVVAAVP
jgi:uncharacterized membrane protein YfcA